MKSALRIAYKGDRNSERIELYDGTVRLGSVGVVRDPIGTIVGGSVLSYNPRRTNLIDFFDKLQTAKSSLCDGDIAPLLRLRDGFCRVEGYLPRSESNVLYFYEPDPQKRKKLLEKIPFVKRALHGRLEDAVRREASRILKALKHGMTLEEYLRYSQDEDKKLFDKDASSEEPPS